LPQRVHRLKADANARTFTCGTRQRPKSGVAWSALMIGCRPNEGDDVSDTADLFEMRRLEALSNTIFGVAMTLLAYNFPRGQILNGAPVWSTIWAAYQTQIIALLISFVVAGMFWISHQRRLAYQPHATRPVLYLNLLFLLSIILLPVTSGLYGTYGNTRDIVVIYCCHLTVLAGSNGFLWLLAGLARGQPSMAVGMAFTTTVFFLASLFALIAPQTYVAQWLLNVAFATPFIDGFFDRRRRSRIR
jgi:TMEM175 potassium channel family protein